MGSLSDLRQTSRVQNGQMQGTYGQLAKNKVSVEDLSKKRIL